MDRPEFVVIGFIHRAHGLSGVVAVENLTDNPERFKTLRETIVEVRDRRIRFRIESCTATPKGWLIKLEGVDDKDRADQLKGGYLLTEASELPELEDGNYYLFDLIGVEVFTTSGEQLGKIVEINQYPANDVYLIEGDKGRLSIPAIRDIVKKVDLKNNRMEVELLTGLEFE